MKIDNQNYESRLCKTYFSIVGSNLTTEVTLDQICEEAKISREEAEKIVPKNSLEYKYFFLKILISQLDKEVLTELKEDLADDIISSTYDKILEGLSLRFEKYAQYKKALKILSKSYKRRIEVFVNLFQQNYDFSTNL